MINTKLVAWSLGTFVAFSFLICVIYGAVAPENLHARALLEMALPGFEWLTPGGFFIGLIESFLYGAYGGLVFSLIYNMFNRRWGRRESGVRGAHE